MSTRIATRHSTMPGESHSSCRHQLRSAPLGLVLLATLLTCLPAFAQSDALQFDVFLGYDQATKEGNWFPVVCEIQNPGPALVCRIEITPAAAGAGQVQQMPIELPTGTLKRVTLPAFAAGRYAGAWNVRLFNEQGKVLAEHVGLRPRVQVGWETKMMGALARTAGGAPMIRSLPRNQPELQPTTARFQPSVFPDNPLLLEGMDALYLNSEVVPALRNEQVSALIGWLNAGGHLIVGLEQVADVTSQRWLRELLPFDPKDSQSITNRGQLHDWLTGTSGTGSHNRLTAERPFAELRPDTVFELANLPMLTGEVRDGRVLLAAEGHPLLVQATRGLGRVTVLTFSPEREPFRSWRNAPEFWAQLVGVPGELYRTGQTASGQYGQGVDGLFGAMIDSRQIRKLPIGWLLGLLAIYLLVIGPFDRWVLKRLGKPMLTWITFPGYVVLFSTLIYLIGYRLRAGETEFNELHLVDALPNNQRAELRGRTYVSIYSPANARFDLASRQKFATLRGESLGSSGGGSTEKITVTSQGDSFRASVFVPVWSSQLYASDWWQSANLPFVAKVVRKPGDWTLTLENKTAQPVKHARLVIGERIWTLEEVAAGQTQTLKLTQQNAQALLPFVQQQGNAFQNVIMSRQFAFGETRAGQIDDLPNATTAVSFLRYLSGDEPHRGFVLPQGLDLSPVVRAGGAVLLVWSPDYSPVPSLHSSAAKRGFQHTLWRLPVIVQDQ